MSQNLGSALKWAIENSEVSNKTEGGETTSTQSPAVQRSQLNPEVLNALFGGPSDADLMRDSILAIQHPEVSLENKLVAFDNFEQLVENIDNANNMESLKLWTPLVELLSHEEAELRAYSAWCLGTAVQNNIKAQERMHVCGAIPTLSKMAVDDSSPQARKKAILALSSGVRNYQPSLDVAVKNLPQEHTQNSSMQADDMEAIDGLMQRLREASQQKG